MIKESVRIGIFPGGISWSLGRVRVVSFTNGKSFVNDTRVIQAQWFTGPLPPWERVSLGRARAYILREYLRAQRVCGWRLSTIESFIERTEHTGVELMIL